MGTNFASANKNAKRKYLYLFIQDTWLKLNIPDLQGVFWFVISVYVFDISDY